MAGLNYDFHLDVVVFCTGKDTTDQRESSLTWLQLV